MFCNISLCGFDVKWNADCEYFSMFIFPVFAWEAYEKGTDAHLQADPTKLALLSKEYKKKKHEYKHSVKQNILDKYGGEEHLEAPSKELLLSQSVSR